MEAILDYLKQNWEAWLPALRTAGRVVVILALAWLLLAMSRRLIRVFRAYMSGRAPGAEEVKRIDTLGRVFRYTASVIIILVAGMLVLSELGISIAPILGAAGVVGVAVGFGAQSLIKDYFAGFFLLLENQVRQGDVVEAGSKAGLVEEVTLRYMRLRDYEGNVHYVPNGLITTVTNRSRGYAYAVIDASIACTENIDQAFEVMSQVGREMRASADLGPKILEDLEIAGVENWTESALILRGRIKVVPLEQWNVRREFLKRLKHAFESHGIETPSPQLTLYPGLSKDGSAPLVHVLQVQPDAQAQKQA